MSISQEVHDQIVKVVTDNPGLTHNEIAALVLSSENKHKLAICRHKKQLIKDGDDTFSWEKASNNYVHWYINGAPRIIIARSVTGSVRSRAPSEPVTQDDFGSLYATSRANEIDKLMKPRVAA